MIHANVASKAGRRVLVVGGDGYCGWPSAVHLSTRGCKVAIVDYFRRQWDHQLAIATLAAPLAD